MSQPPTSDPRGRDLSREFSTPIDHCTPLLILASWRISSLRQLHGASMASSSRNGRLPIALATGNDFSHFSAVQKTIRTRYL
jgi:hypothetical protein